MHRPKIRSFSYLIIPIILALITSISIDTFAGPEHEKPVKVFINAVRYKKDALATKQLALAEMAQSLNRDHWSQFSASEQAEFAQSLGLLIEKTSYPKARDIFEHIDAILYSKPTMKDDKAIVQTTIVVHRAYKKQELQLQWVLVQKAGKWAIFDVITAGDSTIEGLRQDEVNPLVKKGGTKLLLTKLREKVAEAKKS